MFSFGVYQLALCLFVFDHRSVFSVCLTFGLEVLPHIASASKKTITLKRQFSVIFRDFHDRKFDSTEKTVI